MSRLQSGRSWAWVGLAGLTAFALAGFAAPRLGDAPPVCLLRLVSGVPCPGCGLTRACAWLARGELGRALTFHPLAPLLLLEAGLAWGWWGAVLLGRARWPGPRFGMAALWANLLLLLAIWVVRLATGSLP